MWELRAPQVSKTGKVVKTPAANAGDTSLIPGSGRSPGGGHDIRGHSLKGRTESEERREKTRVFHPAVLAQGISRGMEKMWLVLRAEKGGCFKDQIGGC